MEHIGNTKKNLEYLRNHWFISKHKIFEMLGDTILENLSLVKKIKSMDDLLEEIFIENNELREENNNYKNDYLYTENQLLKEEVNKLNNLCSKLTQENATIDNHIKELENDLEDYYKIQDKLIDKYEESYNERMIVAALEKTTDDKETYKKVINILCDKYDIKHSEVFDIIDNIKNNSIERER